MKKIRPHFEPHLLVNEIRLSKGKSWRPDFRGWCMAQIVSGLSYWQDGNEMCEVAAGSTLIFAAETRGVVRASQSSDLSLTYFCIETSNLRGLLSLHEQYQLKQLAERKNPAVRIHGPDTRISQEFKTRPNPTGTVSAMRLRLLQVFMDGFDWDAGEESVTPAQWGGRERFRQVLNQIPASEFTHLSLSELAPRMSCSPRHLNRLFRDELGTSFREKQIELRLAKACELLANSNAKVVEVALESGYQSSSVFSELFKRRYGVSPGRWRSERLHERPATSALS
jgi:AraC-like DNA-binding protein